MTAKILTHKFHSMVADGADATLVRPSNWNDDHDLWLDHRSVTATTDTITHADHMSLIEYNNAAGVVANIAAPTAGAMPRGWFVRLRNIGMGAVTLTGTGGANINGQATLEIAQGEAVDLHSRGTADYAGITLSAQQAQPSLVGGGGVLRYVSVTQLSYLPFRGGNILVNGEAVPVLPGLGVAGLTNGPTFVNGVANQNLAGNTNYFVYGFMNGDVLTADFSTTGHETSNAPGNVGTEIKSGDNSRSLIGYIRTNTTGQFADSRNQRYVRSWFNDPGIHLQSWFTINRSTASASSVQLSAEIQIEWINFADELIMLDYVGAVYNAGTVQTNAFCRIGIDGVSAAVAPLEGTMAIWGLYVDMASHNVASRFQLRPGEGYHWSSIYAASNPAQNIIHWTASNIPSMRPTLEGVIAPRR
ncbi:MAG: hypothetical protein C5B54_07280 [Acidobacteria bacterium]|nr:MAG: hypothetical protein C5B54_07280 [Acidobacteriota bacterium]